MSDTALQPVLTPEERRNLEELYRLQISSLRSLARLLGYPCPIVSREERREVTRQQLAAHAIVETSKH